MNTFWVQIDVQLSDYTSRFFMNDCGGRDQVVAAINQGGWRAYETPLPEVIAKLCNGMKPIFLDVGANTGYYSLIAATTGAKKVYAFETERSTHKILLTNIIESSMGSRIAVYDEYVGLPDHALMLEKEKGGLKPSKITLSFNQDLTINHSAEFEIKSTSIDAFEAAHKSELKNQQTLIKIDASYVAPQVLEGGIDFVSIHRPVILLAVSSESDVAFFEKFCLLNQYRHLWLKRGQPLDISLTNGDGIHRNRWYLLIPNEKAGNTQENQQSNAT